jgi:hypothetical protein
MSGFSEEQKTALAAELLLMFPPSIRSSVLESGAIAERYGLIAEPTLTVGDTGFSIRRSQLFACIRKLYGGEPFVEAVSVNGANARLEMASVGGERHTSVTVDGRKLYLPSYWFLSEDAAERLAEFEREIAQRDLPKSRVDTWRARLGTSPLTDKEADDLQTEFRNTPQEVASGIDAELQKPRADIRVLVPRSLDYYERLLGDLSANTLEEYLQRTAPKQAARLLEWDFGRGLAQFLLICGQPSFATLVDLSGQPQNEVEQFFSWVESEGDLFSQVAAFEIGVRAVGTFPNLEAILLKIACRILDEDVSGNGGRLALSAGLFVFIDGELSRLGLFKGKPPFLRRLAAIAQAAIMEREIAPRVSLENAATWASGGRFEQFFMQSFVDLRTEPRWLPDLMSNRQLRFEFWSRIRSAVISAGDRLPKGQLHDAVLGASGKGGPTGMDSLLTHLPGPLEGGVAAVLPIPDDILRDLGKPDDDQVLEADSLTGITTAALVFRVDSEIARKVAEILRGVKYRLNFGGKTGVSFFLLAGLAMVAAVSRTPQLTGEVRILSRVLHRRGELEYDSDNAMRIAMIACAAHAEAEPWARAVGDWFLELACEPISVATAGMLRSNLRLLGQIDSSLWPFLAKADAALACVLGSAPRRPRETPVESS